MAYPQVFTTGEEVINSVTHGLGALFSVAALVILAVSSAFYGSAWHVVSFVIYGSTLVFLYLMSAIFHGLRAGKVKRAMDVFEILDHSGVFILIAGTYTPFCFIVIQGALGWTIFGIVWGLTVGGIIFKLYFVKRFVFVSTLIYVLMGWLVVLAYGKVVATLPAAGLYLLVGGGIIYTVGTVFYIWQLFKFHHAVWHLFVLGGSVCHFLCVLFYVLPLKV